MIVIDLSQTLYASILAYDIKSPDKIDINLFRHLCLNAIHNILSKFKFDYGNKIIIACDSKVNWRKDLFPYYKYNRKKSRDNSNIDWSKIFENFEIIKDEIKQVFKHYKTIEVEGAEADDIIYCTAKYCYNRNEKLLIISSDKDLVQLQKYNNIKQFDSIRKIYKETDDPIKFLEYQVFKGDSSDGIPNILSPSNTYYTGIRSKPLRESKIKEWLDDPAFTFNPKQVLGEDIYNRYELNNKLIDLSNLPKNLFEEKTSIIESPFNSRDNNELLDYMCKNRLSNLIQHIQDF